ncbi:MAG TPA: hypothetical protein VHR45_19410 [Thermoanaerobaculia bacterium]|nr:hypothetical protein [Thermoanaerobaculia bacterium]
MIVEAALILSSFAIALACLLVVRRRDRRLARVLGSGDVAALLALARRDLRRPPPAPPAGDVDQHLAAALRWRLAALPPPALVQLGDAALASDHALARAVFAEVYRALDQLQRRHDEHRERVRAWRTLRLSLDSSSTATRSTPAAPAYLEPVAAEPPQPSRDRQPA